MLRKLAEINHLLNDRDLSDDDEKAEVLIKKG
jgi:hypothetical protein